MNILDHRLRQRLLLLVASCFAAAQVASAQNQSPVVNAGPDRVVTLPTSASLNGAATDDGLPNPPANVTFQWSKVSGPGTVTFADPAESVTVASFSAAGAYVLRLTGNDGALSASDDINVTVNAPTSASTHVWVRAHTGTLSGLMHKGTLYAAGSLTNNLIFPELNVYNTGNTTQADAVTYTINIPAAGTWYLWGRMYYPGTTAQPTNDPNSFWAAVDNGTAKNLGNGNTKDQIWHWDNTAGVAISLGTLSAGNHTLKIWNREARETSTIKLSPRLDVLLLTSLAAYVPTDADAVAGIGGGGSGAPYPQSSVITNVTWAAPSSIVRLASGSDCWPITWADDGNLYTAYGDGRGFTPLVPSKLSLGFSRVSGSATSFTGTNIHPSNGEQVGDGASGKKASGMIMINGVLYMWMRNANGSGQQSQLAWSNDRGVTWTFGTWTFAEFGYPTFINYGQNYAGAPDNYVYSVSHDNPSAYNPADRFILMRVLKTQITNKASYEFFRGFDANNNPLWTTTISQRTGVFTHAGRCRRSGISYDPGINRYLWWQMYHEDGVDSRFSGGFGVYDAPNPWGPWTTAYFTTAWDVGPGETASFPPKWMSADGRTVYLVFSGDDAFSVRQATFSIAGGGPLIGNLTVNDSANAADWSIQSNLQVGSTQYGDRTYTFSSVPSSVAGSAWIRTANDSKSFTGATLATFVVGQNANVYVTHADAITPKPSWLSGWTDTGENVVNNEAAPKTFSLFRRSFSTGATVTVGPNGSTVAGLYSIIVKPQ